jgi:ADP-ribose pyrophosphatase YjhB (NUDIX family)
MTGDLKSRYPHLFQKTLWPWGPTQAKFEFLKEPPPARLIANVNIAPRVGRQWVMLRLEDGTWDIPGGTIEPGEDYISAIRRGLVKEAGALLISLKIFGAWKCTCRAAKPYRPHLPYPNYYRMVGVGEVNIIQLPSNPPGGEQVASVELASLDAIMSRFASIERPDLGELYQLANWVIHQEH